MYTIKEQFFKNIFNADKSVVRKAFLYTSGSNTTFLKAKLYVCRSLNLYNTYNI